MVEYSLVNTLHINDNGIHIYICTKNYYPDNSGYYNFTIPDGTIITILCDCVLIYIPIWSPASEEIDFCLCVAFISRNSWYQFLLGDFLNYLAPLCPVLSV